jgi:hypothetical protein
MAAEEKVSPLPPGIESQKIWLSQFLTQHPFHKNETALLSGMLLPSELLYSGSRLKQKTCPLGIFLTKSGLIQKQSEKDL